MNNSESGRNCADRAACERAASDLSMKRRKPFRKVHTRTISGQFPCPCVTFNHKEPNRIWEARLRRRFKSKKAKVLTRDIEEDEDHLRSYIMEGATQFDGSKTLYPSTCCRKEASHHQVTSMKYQAERVGENQTRPYTKETPARYDGNPSLYCKTEVGEEEEDKMRLYFNKTARCNDNKIIYPSASCRREAHPGICCTKCRTCQANSRCGSFANCPRCCGPFNLFETQTSRAQIQPDQFRYAHPNDMVVPRCFQFHSQVISGGCPCTAKHNFQVRCDGRAVYESPSRENGNGMVAPNSTKKLEVDDVAHQLQGENDRCDLNCRHRERWSHFNPQRSSELEKYYKNPEGCLKCKRRHPGIGPQLKPSYRLQSNNERWSQYIGLRSGSSPQPDHREPPKKRCRRCGKIYSVSYNCQSKSASSDGQQKFVCDGIPRHTINSEQFSENNQADRAVGNHHTTKCRLPNLENSNIPEKDSPNSLATDDNFVRHLFGTDYDVTTRNYRRFNDDAHDILNYDISDSLLGRPGLEPKSESSRDDDSSGAATEVRYQSTLDSLQKKMNRWKDI